MVSKKNKQVYFLYTDVVALAAPIGIFFGRLANFVNSENYFIVQGNVIGEGPLGNVAADKLNVDLIQKKMKISMYNESKVNIKVNY